MKYAQNATRELVIEFLVEHYHCDRTLADQCCERQRGVLDAGIKLGSFANYLGDRIAAVEALIPRVDEDEDKDDG